MGDTQGYRIHSAETWRHARDDYLTGFSAEEVCSRYDMGLSAFRARARREGWRRVDQSDPDIVVEDLSVLPDAGLADMVRTAWKRMSAAILLGRGVEAGRWQRIHDALHLRAADEAEARHRESLSAARQSGRPVDAAAPWPRLTATGENVHDVHANFLEDALAVDEVDAPARTATPPP